MGNRVAGKWRSRGPQGPACESEGGCQDRRRLQCRRTIRSALKANLRRLPLVRLRDAERRGGTSDGPPCSAASPAETLGLSTLAWSRPTRRGATASAGPSASESAPSTGASARPIRACTARPGAGVVCQAPQPLFPNGCPDDRSRLHAGAGAPADAADIALKPQESRGYVAFHVTGFAASPTRSLIARRARNALRPRPGIGRGNTAGGSFYPVGYGDSKWSLARCDGHRDSAPRQRGAARVPHPVRPHRR